MRYNSESLEIKVVISGNVLLFRSVKISLGLLIIARKMFALFRGNRYLEVSTTANNRIRFPVVEPKIRSKTCYSFLVFTRSLKKYSALLLLTYYLWAWLPQL